ncbi:MAG: hypothetical protein U5R31_00850 [Acidimicrobiia bacterium]|nr:hypothetical protein [Acidimicrobiia bacterium]
MSTRPAIWPGGTRVVGLLWDAIHDAAANERAARVHIEYQVQKRDGDPSPAHTVAAMLGLRPANVRQIDRRTRARLGELVTASERYRTLRRLDWFDWLDARPDARPDAGLDGGRAA